jgi:anti-sigma B factor antagonist
VSQSESLIINPFQVFAVSTIDTRIEADILIIYLQDVRIIDERRITALGQELNELLHETESKRIVLNFQNVGFMSSAMIGKLVEFNKKCNSLDAKLRLCDISENVGEVFSLMRLDKVFQIDKDEQSSLKNFSKKSWFGR